MMTVEDNKKLETTNRKDTMLAIETKIYKRIRVVYSPYFCTNMNTNKNFSTNMNNISYGNLLVKKYLKTLRVINQA